MNRNIKINCSLKKYISEHELVFKIAPTKNVLTLAFNNIKLLGIHVVIIYAYVLQKMKYTLHNLSNIVPCFSLLKCSVNFLTLSK